MLLIRSVASAMGPVPSITVSVVPDLQDRVQESCAAENVSHDSSSNDDNDVSDVSASGPHRMIYQLSRRQDLPGGVRADDAVARHSRLMPTRRDSAPSRCGAGGDFGQAAPPMRRPPFAIDASGSATVWLRWSRRWRSTTPFAQPAAFPQASAAAAEGAGGGADVRPFRHVAARHRAGAAAGPRCLHHRLAQCAATFRCRTGRSGSTISSTT